VGDDFNGSWSPADPTPYNSSVAADAMPVEPKNGATQPVGQPEETINDALGAAHEKAWAFLSGYAGSLVPRDAAGTVAAGGGDLVPDFPSINDPRQHWSVKNSSVKVSPGIEDRINSVAQDFYNRTGKNLIATDGNRTPADQAQRMYDKFIDGDNTTYRGPAGQEIRSIFDSGFSAGLDKSKIIANMTSRIQQQLANGHPVSNHLLDRGVDFHTGDLSDAEKQILNEAVRRNSGRFLQEGVHPHTHASF
jgi:hypothetical protein